MRLDHQKILGLGVLLSAALFLSACQQESSKAMDATELKHHIKYYQQQTYYCFLDSYLAVENPTLNIEIIAKRLHTTCSQQFTDLRMASIGYVNTPDAINPTHQTIEKELNQCKSFITRLRKQRQNFIDQHKGVIKSMPSTREVI